MVHMPKEIGPHAEHHFFAHKSEHAITQMPDQHSPANCGE